MSKCAEKIRTPFRTLTSLKNKIVENGGLNCKVLSDILC